MATTNGVTVADISVIGRATLWTNSGSIPGRTVGCMRASIVTTKNMAMAFTHGVIRKSTLVGGIKASSMVWVFSSSIMVLKRNTASGRMEKNCVGSSRRKLRPSKKGRFWTLLKYS
jgi:hypothetical protein